jgi:hypothetical protein
MTFFKHHFLKFILSIAIVFPFTKALDGVAAHKTNQAFTSHDLEELKRLRDDLRLHSALFNSRLRGMDSLYRTALLARLTSQHMFLYGPPGSGKSALASYMASSEGPFFYLQLHQQTPETALIGGQKFTALTNGTYDIANEGSLSSFELGILDEFDKANPSTLMSALSLLNTNERLVLVGHRVIPSKLETVFATSNANMYEIIERYDSESQKQTAYAIFDRFLFKGFAYNWLSEDHQKVIDSYHRKRAVVKVLAAEDPSLNANFFVMAPPRINWDVARKLMKKLFTDESLLDVALLEFTNAFRKDTNEFIEKNLEDNEYSESYEKNIYEPSHRMSERTRSKLISTIQAHAFIDFILSPMADDDYIEQVTQKPIKLTHVSMWRLFPLFTTVGSGSAQLVITEDHQISVEFKFDFDRQNALDERERSMISFFLAEQERFNLNYQKILSRIQTQMPSAASAYTNKKTDEFDDNEFNQFERNNHFESQLILSRSLL